MPFSIINKHSKWLHLAQFNKKPITITSILFSFSCLPSLKGSMVSLFIEHFVQIKMRELHFSERKKFNFQGEMLSGQDLVLFSPLNLVFLTSILSQAMGD